MRYVLRAVSGTIGVALLAGCGGGGGGGGGPGPTPTTVMLSSEAALDGSVIGGTLHANDTSVFAGDQDFFDAMSGASVSVAMRAFWSFDLSTLPTGVTIVSATFSVDQTGVTGGPYAELGALALDHLDYGSTFELADYTIASIAPAFATLSSDASLVTKTVDVTARVQADLAAARTRTQFRARFSPDSNLDDTQDYAVFTCSESAAGNPVLTVTYTP